MRRSLLVVFAASAAGCNIFKDPPPAYDSDEPETEADADADADTDADTDGDADADTDSDTDSDTDADADADTDAEPSLDCDEPVEPAEPEDYCVTAEIGCGDSIVATTRGGTSAMDESGYTSWYCMTIPDGDYAGPERTYSFEYPLAEKVVFTLDSPCEDLDLIVMRWEYWESDGDCPTEDNAILECDISEGSGEVTVAASDEGWNYLVVVDGPDPVEAPFRLSVECDK